MPRIPETAHPDLFSESPTAQSAPWDAMSEQELMDYAVLHGLRDIPPEHLTDDVVAAWESQGALLSFTEALDTAQPITADAIYENRWHLLTDEEVQSALQSAGVEVDPAQLQRLFQRARNRPRENPSYSFLPLKTVERYVAMAAKRGVSEVARSSRGFLTQYRRHGRQGLDPHWARKREGFIARHMAQVSMRREELFDANGQPSRRHLALIMWAYSPTPQKL